MTRKERKDIKNRKKLIKKSRKSGSKFVKGMKVCRIGLGVVLIGCIGFLGVKWVSDRVEWKNGLWGISESSETKSEQIAENTTIIEEIDTEEDSENIEDIITKQEADKMILRMNNLNRYNFSELADSLNDISKLYYKGTWLSFSETNQINENTEAESNENTETEVENLEIVDETLEYEKQYYVDISETTTEKIELTQNDSKLYEIVDESIIIDSWSSIIPDKGCVIIIAKIKDNSSNIFKDLTRNYMQKLTEANEDSELYYIYNEYSELSYNNYSIICACDNKDKVVNLIIDYMVSQDDKAVSILN